MTEMRSMISETGISVAYEPPDGSPLVDIVIIHGLQGHPYKTWACNTNPKAPESPVLFSPGGPENGSGRRKNILRGAISPLLGKPSAKNTPTVKSDAKLTASLEGINGKSSSVFWPADLLPVECPNSRILSYGYDSKITKYMAGATNKNSVFSHSKDLLFALSRERIGNLGRPLIFVAHSLGGIIVKETLARSSASTEVDLEDIVNSTAAVVFLGTPHRGSPELGAIAEWVRSVLGILRMETTSTILDALGLKTTDLERAQEAFSSLWQKYDFRVKTFQEGRGLTGVHLGVLGNKVVPDYSSLIGDHRERAETIDANHMEMCRFLGAKDPNYRKVAGSLQSIYLSIAALQLQEAGADRHTQSLALALIPEPLVGIPKRADADELSDVEKACLRSLQFPCMNHRRQSLNKPAEQTGLWLFEHEMYQDWFSGRSRDKDYGLLWLKGKPGVGKSILMKEAFQRATMIQATSDYSTAAFFFNSKGTELEHSPIGLFRSLLYQLLPRQRQRLESFSRNWQGSNLEGKESTEENSLNFTERELRFFFRSLVLEQLAKKIFIFIDALDECDPDDIRPQAYFWREVTKSSYNLGVDLNVCLSSRHFPSITVGDCSEIVVEKHNTHDIALYVDQKFRLGISTEEPQWQLLKDKIMTKSAGVFFWVALVLEEILKSWDEGKGLQYLLKQLSNIPEELETLFSQMFLSLSPEARHSTIRLFQWALLASKPLRLYEWHHILAFISQPTPASLNECRTSASLTENDIQLGKQIKSISKGLLEVKNIVHEPQNSGFETMSMCASAGSLDLEHGETRVVQVVHESVRDFFLKGNGFYILDPTLQSNPIGEGHLAIMATCLDYLNISELDSLVQARNEAAYGSSHSTSAHIASLQKSSDCHNIEPVPVSVLAMGRTEQRQTIHAHNPQLPDTLRNHTLASEKETSIHTNRIQSRPQTQRQGTTEGSSIIESLAISSASAPTSEIALWLETSQLVADRISLHGSAQCSITNVSDAGHTRLLEDYFALLSYATFEMFTHARKAEDAGADATNIIRRFKEKKTWARWVALREDLPPGIDLLHYAISMNLSTWVSSVLLSYIYIKDNPDSWGGEDDWLETRTPGFEPFLKEEAALAAQFGEAALHTTTLKTAASGDGSQVIRPHRDNDSLSKSHGKQVVAGSRHKRVWKVWKACERCRMKKTKCDGEMPCKRCKNDGLVCTAGTRSKTEYKQLPIGYTELLENTQLALISTVHKLYAMVRNSEHWNLGEPELNNRGQPVIHDIVSKLGCIERSGDKDLPMATVFPEDEAEVDSRSVASFGSASSHTGL